jgi:hypothetical protein
MAKENLLLTQNTPAAGDGRAGPEVASSLDEPMEAIVYDIHPAMGAMLDAGYPYGPRTHLPPAQHEPLVVVEAVNWAVKSVEVYIAAIRRPPDYVVPKTFGMSAILGLMTALALLFACLRRLDSYPVFYFFFSVEAIAICLAQMLYGQAPRQASIIAGAIILPAFTVVAGMLRPDVHPVVVYCLAIGFIPLGACLGYLTGTCAAGIFLVMECLEPYLQGQGFSRTRPTT